MPNPWWPTQSLDRWAGFNLNTFLLFDCLTGELCKLVLRFRPCDVPGPLSSRPSSAAGSWTARQTIRGRSTIPDESSDRLFGLARDHTILQRGLWKARCVLDQRHQPFRLGLETVLLHLQNSAELCQTGPKIPVCIGTAQTYLEKAS